MQFKAGEGRSELPDWSNSSIGALCDDGIADLQTGPFGSQLHASDYVARGIAVVPTEAIQQRRIIHSSLPHISKETAARLHRHSLIPDDILFARRGVQATGKIALVREEERGFICGTGAIRLRVKQGNDIIDAGFLSHVLSNEEATAWFKFHAIGATMPNLNEGIIRSFPLRIPPMSEQLEVSRLMTAIESRFNLLSESNQTLEAVSRAIFQSWFVDFDPVRAKAEGREPEGMDAATAALFPDRLEGSTHGDIPRGWTAGRLGEVCEVARDAVQRAAMLDHENYVGLEHIPRESWSLQEWGNAEALQSGKSRFVRGDILFGKLRPYFHKVCIAPIDGVCSTDILVLRPDSTWAPFVLCHVSSKALIEYATRLSNGAKMPRTKWQDLESYAIAIPPASVARAFTSIVEPMVEKIIENVHAARSLADLRDTLLPRLISGKLRVPEAEKLVEAVL